MCPPPKKPDNCESKTPSEPYLKEALRLSELKIEYQHRASAILERKAVLLTTLCLVIIGYLLPLDLLSLEGIWDIWDKNLIMKIPLIIWLIILIPLTIATLRSSSILFPYPFGIPGASPKYLMQKTLKCDFNEMAENLLKNYDEKYELNKKAISEKTKIFNEALCWGQGGIICAFFGIIINKIPGDIIIKLLKSFS